LGKLAAGPARLLAARPLRIERLVGGLNRPITAEGIAKAFEPTQTAYGATGARQRLVVEAGRKPADSVSAWRAVQGEVDLRESGMPQLVGSPCTLCEQRIGSVLEGAFCDSCGRPYHYECRKSQSALANQGKCASCGGDTPNAVATQVHSEKERKIAISEEDKKPDTKITRKLWLYMFLASGSFWFGTLAVALDLVSISGVVLGWRYVESGATWGPGALAERFGVRAPRFELTINDRTGTHFWNGDRVIMYAAGFLMALGFILALVAFFAASGKGRLLPMAILVNVLALLLPLVKLFFPPGW
jgi:hypothetical protein